MKHLQKYQVTVAQGKISDEKLLEERPVADSVADDLLQEAKEFDPKKLDPKQVHFVVIWKEKKKEKEFILATATKPQLLAYAEENGIDLGDAKTNDEIRAAIAEKQE